MTLAEADRKNRDQAASSELLSLVGLTNGNRNKLLPADQPVHDWYRFVLSYPPQLIRHYLEAFDIQKEARVLDPFCGTGTTLVECKKRGIPSIGLEAHPMVAFAADVKTDWDIDSEALRRFAGSFAGAIRRHFQKPPGELLTLPSDGHKLLLKNSVSPLPFHKLLLLRSYLAKHADKAFYPHMLLAFAATAVNDASNLHFGPEVGVRGWKEDAAVLASWLARVQRIANDLEEVDADDAPSAKVWRHDSRAAHVLIPPASLDAVITSPPYPNEKDYTRTTRLETVLLGYAGSRRQLRRLKEGLLRSNTRNVYKGDDDYRWIAQFPSIHRLADAIEDRRLALGKTSGFERNYARVTLLYFGGMARHLGDLRPLLRPGARLAYVVGDQASYLQVMIRTGQLLAEIAESLGYEVDSLDLFRTRLATATGEQLREEVLVLTWPGT